MSSDVFKMNIGARFCCTHCEALTAQYMQLIYLKRTRLGERHVGRSTDVIWIYKIYCLIPEGCNVRRLNGTSVQGMKRSCPGVRCYMSLSKGNILWYRSKPITATLSHLSQGTNMRFTFPLQASLVSASARMIGKHGSTFSHKFPICSCHQSQDWSSAGDLTQPGFLLIQS